MTEFNFQLNIKLPDGDLMNIRAEDPEEFRENLEFVLEIAEKLAATSSAVRSAYGEVLASQGAQVAVTNLGATVISASPVSQSEIAAFVAHQAPVSGAPAGAQEPVTVTDKWGNEWEYNNPVAPETPRGLAVKKTALSSKGNRYSKWMDPCKGPRWYPTPKPPADQIIEFDGFAR